MKKFILLTLTALMMAGCRYETTSVNTTEAVRTDVTEIIVDKYTLDSCEYYPHYGHKGSCRFCKERRQKELEELIIKLKEN